MVTDQIYWNPVLETLGREKIRQLQLKKFKKIFKWAYERSIFHRKIYDEAGLEPEDIRSFEDIQRVPRVEKSMMQDIQRVCCILCLRMYIKGFGWGFGLI